MTSHDLGELNKRRRTAETTEGVEKSILETDLCIYGNVLTVEHYREESMHKRGYGSF